MARKLWLSRPGNIDPFDFRCGVDQWSDTASWLPAGTRAVSLYALDIHRA